MRQGVKPAPLSLKWTVLSPKEPLNPFGSDLLRIMESKKLLILRDIKLHWRWRWRTRRPCQCQCPWVLALQVQTSLSGILVIPKKILLSSWSNWGKFSLFWILQKRRLTLCHATLLYHLGRDQGLQLQASEEKVGFEWPLPPRIHHCFGMNLDMAFEVNEIIKRLRFNIMVIITYPHPSGPDLRHRRPTTSRDRNGNGNLRSSSTRLFWYSSFPVIDLLS